MITRFVLLLWLSLATAFAADSERFFADVSYMASGSTSDAYRTERAVLDLYVPADAHASPVVVWFHGGGLTQGKKWIPDELRHQGCLVVSPNYRLTPRVRTIDALDDAATAVAWVFSNIKNYGGNPDAIILSGHSAGAYLSTMLALDGKWLAAHGFEANRLAGVVALSTQAITHAAARQEQNVPATRPVVNELAPLFHVRADAPPLLLITGDREKELWGRYEENAYLARMMAVAGHSRTRLIELAGTDHGSMVPPSFPHLLRFVSELPRSTP